MLEAIKNSVAPVINFPLMLQIDEATLYGLMPKIAAKNGLKKEVEIVLCVMNEMRKRGIKFLLGSDFRFA